MMDYEERLGLFRIRQVMNDDKVIDLQDCWVRDVKKCVQEFFVDEIPEDPEKTSD